MFRPGDRVMLVDLESPDARHAVWVVVAEDTNRTPVYDSEPAYRLRVDQPRTERHSPRERYAYQSHLRLA